MTDQERQDATDVLRYLRGKLMAADPTIEAFNVGMNCGAEAASPCSMPTGT